MDIEAQVLKIGVSDKETKKLYKSLMENLLSQHYAVFKSFLNRGLNKQYPNFDINYIYPYPLCTSLLDVACTHGYCDFIKLLLDSGAETNKINEAHGLAPIHFATEIGNPIALKILLENEKTDPNLEGHRETALHIAVRKNYPICVEKLLEFMADPNIPNIKGASALALAASLSNKEIVRIIMQESRYLLDIDSFQDIDNNSPRIVLETKFPNLVIPPPRPKKINFYVLRLFLDKGDEIQFLDYLKRYIQLTNEEIDKLLVICTTKNFRIPITELLRRREIKNCGPVSQAALDAAVKSGLHDVLEKFLSTGAKIENSQILIACRELGVPCLNRIGQRSRLQCLMIILKQPKINVRCEDERGNSPLYYAARADEPEAVNLLLKAGSYIGHKNVFGTPPIVHMPEDLLTKHFDNCMQRSNEFGIKFNYKCLMPHFDPDNADNLKQPFPSLDIVQNCPSTQEMDTLSYISNNSSIKHLLKHPVLASFLFMKAHGIKPILNINLVLNIFFYLLPIYYIFADLITDNESRWLNMDYWDSIKVLWVFTAYSLILLIVRETFHFAISPFHYFNQITNILDFFFIILVFAVLAGATIYVSVLVIFLSSWKLSINMCQHPYMPSLIGILKNTIMRLIILLFMYLLLRIAFSQDFSTQSKVIENIGPFIFVNFSFLIYILFFLEFFTIWTCNLFGDSELTCLISQIKIISFVEQLLIKHNFIKKCFLIFVDNFPAGKFDFPFSNYSHQMRCHGKSFEWESCIEKDRYNSLLYNSSIFIDMNIVERARELLTKKHKASEDEKMLATKFISIDHRINFLQSILEGMNYILENYDIYEHK